MQTTAPWQSPAPHCESRHSPRPLADQSFLADREDFLVAAAVIGMIIHPASEQASPERGDAAGGGMKRRDGGFWMEKAVGQNRDVLLDTLKVSPPGRSVEWVRAKHSVRGWLVLRRSTPSRLAFQRVVFLPGIRAVDRSVGGRRPVRSPSATTSAICRAPRFVVMCHVAT